MIKQSAAPMDILPEYWHSHPVPADYLAFATSLSATRIYNYPGDGMVFDLSLPPAATLLQP